MALTPEQIAELKAQLSEQVQHLPEDQRNEAQKQIDEMSDEAVEAMLEEQKSQQTQEIFRAIIEGKIPSRKIAENESAIAVLDIKPISKGHTVIIPKTQAKNSSEISTNAFDLAKQVSQKIISVLKAQGTEIQTEFKFGEMIINVIPIYEKSLNINSPRTDAKEEELDELQQSLFIKKETEVIKAPEPKVEENEVLEKINRKIP